MPLLTGRRFRIAVVEDNDDLRLLFVMWLQRFHETAAFSCGETFLAELEKLKPDVVVLDVTLPGADGFEVARRLRLRRRFGRVPILFLTGLRPDDIDQVERVAPSSIVTKPLALERLLECVERLLPARALRSPRNRSGLYR